MKLTKAIEILTDDYYNFNRYRNPDLSSAIKLGIEALKEIHRERIGEIPFIGDILPGETEEVTGNTSFRHSTANHHPKDGGK